MFGLGPKELVILAGILVLLFGAKKIPEVAGAIGESIKILRNSFSDDVKSDKTGKNN
jgi:sec-independent protein translocase protein TatA